MKNKVSLFVLIGSLISSTNIMAKEYDNHYSGKIGYEITKEMPIGSYTIEVLAIEGETSRRIYVKLGAFPMYDSASKNIE